MYALNSYITYYVAIVLMNYLLSGIYIPTMSVVSGMVNSNNFNITDKQVIRLSKEKVDARTTEHLHKYMMYKPNFIKYIRQNAGKEHYKMLAELSHQLRDGTVVADVGTLYGASALMLSSNPSVEVITYDIVELIKKNDDANNTPLHKPNIQQRIKSGLDDITEISKCSLVLLDIDPHDGCQEPVFVEALKANGFKGLLVCDDIMLNRNMKRFWSTTTPELKKINVTHLGHWSGTGIIVFDPSTIDVVQE